MLGTQPTGRANARPMTGSAKQSISKQSVDCFVATLLAMTEVYSAYDFCLRRLPYRVVDQRLAERPDRAGDLVAGGDDLVERFCDPAAVFFGDDEWRQQLDGVAAVAGDLREDLVVLEQRHGDELAEQALVGGLQHIPRCLEPQRFRRTELDADHQALAAHFLQQFLSRKHPRQRQPKLVAW